MSNPTVGRVVRYVSHGSPVRADGTQEFRSVERAAIITEVEEGSERVGLCVLNPTGMFFRSLADGGSEYFAGESAPGGTWRWPDRD